MAENLADFPFWIGHRGLRGIVAENTLASFQAAYHAGFRAFETDVKLTKDNKLWLFHDDDCDYLTNISGKASDYTWQELQEITICGTQKPCLLRDLLAWLPNDSFMNLEIKPCPNREIITAEILAQFCHKENFAKDKILISSFDAPCLAKFAQQYPDFPRAFLVEAIPDNYQELCNTTQATALHADNDGFDINLALKIQEKMPVRIYTINDKARAFYLKNLGFSGVFTDFALFS